MTAPGTGRQEKSFQMENKTTFNDLGLTDELLAALNGKGFEEPTDIQALTIPRMLAGESDIIAQAQTGTGKTAAFGLPLLQLIDPADTAVQALILVPTRELAIQVAEEIHSLRGTRPIRTIPIYGGQAFDQQLRRLKSGTQIVVGTPGRVIDHLHRKTLKVDAIRHLILDEADEMLNMGFIEDIEEIMAHTNPDKRTLLFSATMPARIRELARKYMQNHELVTAKKQQLTANLTEQIYFEVKAPDKFEALSRIIDIEDGFYGIVFCRTKSDVDEVASHLTERGYDAEPIHGDIPQTQRERTLDKFRKKRCTILVATDVAARGIDVSDLTHVINYSLPHDPDAYVHRIGRTGRAGKQGTAITFITPSEYKRLMFIQKMARADIKKSTVPKVKDILKARRKKIYEDVTALRESGVQEEFRDWATRLLGNNDPAEFLAALLQYSFAEELNPEAYRVISETGARTKPVDQEGKARLFVGLGKKDNMDPRKLVDMVLARVKLKPAQICDIQIMDSFSFITVPFAKAEEVLDSFNKKGKRPLFTHARKDKK